MEASSFTSSMDGVRTHFSEREMEESMVRVEQSQSQSLNDLNTHFSESLPVGFRHSTPGERARMDQPHGLKRKASPGMMPMGLCQLKRSRLSSSVINAIGINGDEPERNASTDLVITIDDDGENEMQRKFPSLVTMMGTDNQKVFHTIDLAPQVNDQTAFLRNARKQESVYLDRYGFPMNVWPQNNASRPVSTVMNQQYNWNGNTSLSAMDELINYSSSIPRLLSSMETSEPSSDVRKERARPWTKEEDELLIRLVEHYGKKRWTKIAESYFTGRSGKQCSSRWFNDLDPDIKKGVWTAEEDALIIQAHSEMGKKWAEIGKRVPGRSGDMIKNRWYAAGRKLDRMIRSGRAGTTQLHNYISSHRSQECNTSNHAIPLETRPGNIRATIRTNKKCIEPSPTPPAVIPAIRSTDQFQKPYMPQESRPPTVPTVQLQPKEFATSTNNFHHWGSDCIDQQQKYSNSIMLGPIGIHQTETFGVYGSYPDFLVQAPSSFSSNNSRPADRSCSYDLLQTNDDVNDHPMAKVQASTTEIHAGGISTFVNDLGGGSLNEQMIFDHSSSIQTSSVLDSSCTDDLQLQNVEDQINLSVHPSQIEDDPMPIPSPLPETCARTVQPEPVNDSGTDHDQLQNNNFMLPDKLMEGFTPSTLLSEPALETFARDYLPCFELNDFNCSDPWMQCCNNMNYLSAEEVAHEQWDSDGSILMDLSLWS